MRSSDRTFDADEVVDGDILAQHALRSPGFDDWRNSSGDHGEALIQRCAVGCDDGAEDLNHPPLLQHVVDEAVEKASERHVWRVLLEKLGRGAAKLLDLFAVRSLNERLARRVVT